MSTQGIEQFRTEFLTLVSRGSALHAAAVFTSICAHCRVECLCAQGCRGVGGYLCSEFLRSLVCSFAREARRLLLSSLGSLQPAVSTSQLTQW